MKFSNFNTQRLFDIDTSGFDYATLEDLYLQSGKDEEKVYVLRGIYIGTKSQYSDEAPIVATGDSYVNIPQHQLPEVKAMLASQSAVRAINDGEAGFTIKHYYQARFKRDCYKAVWCDVNPVQEL